MKTLAVERATVAPQCSLLPLRHGLPPVGVPGLLLWAGLEEGSILAAVHLLSTGFPPAGAKRLMVTEETGGFTVPQTYAAPTALKAPVTSS